MARSTDDTHRHEHTHSDGTRHAHEHSHPHEHSHDERGAGDAETPGNPVNNDLEQALEVAEAADGTAALPPKPSQQGDGQEAGTAQPRKPTGGR